MDGWHAVLLEACVVQIDLAPAQIDELGRPQAVAIGHEDHGRVTMAMTVLARGLHQHLDLIGLRYSRVRRSAFFRLRGVTVRFTMAEPTTFRCGFLTRIPPFECRLSK
jgi:hypothetical protein